MELSAGEICVMSLALLFDKYASKDGDAATMSKKEVEDMLKSEFKSFYEGCKGEDLLTPLDQDRDGKMNFKEFLVLISAMAFTCKTLMDEFRKKGGK